ncbi:AAA family ATPase [Corallococcus sp. H22C18031201]|uniref:ATP-dependent helicase n=1 Tax=Citreicoccus inhibens TaxID=2849499 RepID=UPI000E722885|nr:UvrD-helicase domain-containing protein [Citreicoccus inhibens]MBU8894265.1 UvrD-helicase domain-containing protein [Citreicoccus inhibens]RJS23045.1 AAA family ATPase [Corallococcus sp. H22C18031201]
MNPHESALLEDLNPPQSEAVLHGDGPLLVLSGAGSGKTRVITRRVAHLVKVRRVFPWRILAVTFTNKAAREMRERLSQLLGPQANELVVSTFHSAAAMILRREAESVGLTRSFVIYDDGDQLTLVKRAMRESRVDPVMQPREILHRIDQEKNAARLPEDMHVDADDVRGVVVKTVYDSYQRLLRAANAVDFGDLLLLLVKLFQTRPDVLERYRTRFTHVLVDEFQDTNPVQYAFLKWMAPPPSANLVVVGDDDQSIYRWRGANVDNILNFPMQYPGARVVKLEQNYRSDQIILEAAHSVIEKNERRMPKKLWSERPRGETLTLLLNRDERAEAQEVARRILAVQREGFIKFSSMAVFYRTNAQSRVLEEALRLARVPYTLVSGRSFYDRAEVRDASAYMRLMVNPRSDADLLRIINTPARGIGDTTVERLTDWANTRGVSVYEALATPSEIPSLNSTAVKRLAGVRRLLESLHHFAQTAKDAASAVDQMLQETKLVETLVAEGSDESETRAENLREFLGAAQEFDLNRAAAMVALAEAAQAADAQPVPPELDAAPLTADVPALQAFLEQISLVGEADAEVGEGRVALMTLHAAKGLEFDAVFLTGMEDGVFPHSRALNSEDPETGEEMAEERRLCYVGFTRARKRLFVSLAQCRSLFGELRYNPPSRFLRDVPQALFGMEEREIPQPPRAVPVAPRKRSWDEDDGPRVDRSYSQTSDMDGIGGDVRGMRVRHEQFGSGRIVSAEGSGPNAKVTVEFGGSVGLKRVIARFLMPG